MIEINLENSNPKMKNYKKKRIEKFIRSQTSAFKFFLKPLKENNTYTVELQCENEILISSSNTPSLSESPKNGKVSNSVLNVDNKQEISKHINVFANDVQSIDSNFNEMSNI